MENLFRDWFRNARRIAGLTQVQVAEAVGVAQTTVSQWESGETKPKPANLKKLAGVFHLRYREVEHYIGLGDEEPGNVELPPRARAIMSIVLELSDDDQQTMLDTAEAMRRRRKGSAVKQS